MHSFDGIQLPPPPPPLPHINGSTLGHTMQFILGGNVVLRLGMTPNNVDCQIIDQTKLTLEPLDNRKSVCMIINRLLITIFLLI